MKSKLAASAFALLLLGFAAPALAAGSTSFEAVWGKGGSNWGAVAAIAVLISILFTALAYMMGLTFQRKHLAVWAKNELYQALASAFMFAFILGFVTYLGAQAAVLSANPFLEYKGCTSDSQCGSGGGGSCLGDFECTPPRTCVYGSALDMVGNVLLGSNPGTCSNGFKCLDNDGDGKKNCTFSCASLVGAYTEGDTSYHIACARKLLQLSEGSMIAQSDQIFNVNMRIQILAAFMKYLDVSIMEEPLPPFWPWEYPSNTASGFSFNPYAGVTMFGDSLGYLLPFLFTWIASFMVQERFLAMIQYTLFPLLLALGLILRTFFFTRKLGGLLMAIAIGLYTVYPLMYILLGSQYAFTETDIWYDKWNPLICSCDTTDMWWMGPGAATLGGSIVQQVGQQAGVISEPLNCPVRFCSLDLAGMIMLSARAPATLGVWSADPLVLPVHWLFNLCTIVGALMVPALFIPVVIIIVTVSFVKGLSPLLGGDVEIAGLTHLI